MKLVRSLFIFGGLAFAVASCGGEDWPEDKVESFKKECVSQLSSAVGDGADGVCDCVIEKLKEDFDSYADADKNIDENWMAEKMMDCVKSTAGGGAEE